MMVRRTMERASLRLVAVSLATSLMLVGCAGVPSFNGDEYQMEGVNAAERERAAKICNTFAREIVENRTDESSGDFSDEEVAEWAFSACMEELGFERV